MSAAAYMDEILEGIRSQGSPFFRNHHIINSLKSTRNNSAPTDLVLLLLLYTEKCSLMIKSD